MTGRLVFLLSWEGPHIDENYGNGVKASLARPVYNTIMVGR